MTTSPTRRSIVKGAVWSAPVVLATTAIPAYAASPTGVVDRVSWHPVVTSTNSLAGVSTGIVSTKSPDYWLTFVGSGGGTVLLESATVIVTFTNTVKPTNTVNPDAFISPWKDPTSYNGWGFAYTSKSFTFTLNNRTGTIGSSDGQGTNFAGFHQNFDLSNNVNSGTYSQTTKIILTYRDSLGEHQFTEEKTETY